MKRLEFESHVAEMVRQFAGRGASMTTVGAFAAFCRSVARRIPDEGVPDVAAAARAYVGALEERGASGKRVAGHRRNLRYLESYLADGRIDFSHAKRVARSPIGGELDSELAGFAEGMRSRGLKGSTVAKWTGYAHRFLSFLHDRGLGSVAGLSAADVSDFLAWVSERHAASGMAGELSMLRALLGHTDLAGITDRAAAWVPRGRHAAPSPVAPLSDEEVAAVIASIDNTTPLGKRDLAIIMLAARAGIRSSEIVALRLSDIDWDAGAVSVRRPKTGTVGRLPMDGQLADAIADYVLNGRPGSPSEEVFLVHRAPFGPFSHGHSLHAVARRRYDAAGVAGRAGLHRLRHTAATGLLRSGAAPDEIAAVLGHAKIENAMRYAAIEAEGLRACCLDLPEGGVR